MTHGILEHREFLFEEDGHGRKRRERTRWIFRGLLEERLAARAMTCISRRGGLDPLVDRIAARETDPYTAVEDVLRTLGL